MNSEIKKSWFNFKIAMIDIELGIISRKKFNKIYDEFYADAEPLIENLEGDDNEKV